MSKQRKRNTKQSVKQPPIKERNSVALNPLLKKSSVHEKSGKAKRTAAKVQLKKTWLDRAAAVAASGSSQVFCFIAASLALPFQQVR